MTRAPGCRGTSREVVAESVAYAVCSRFGLDLSLRSVDYVAGWPWYDPEAFRVGMAAIHDGAASLIDAIEAAMTDAGELDPAASSHPSPPRHPILTQHRSSSMSA